MDEEGGWQEAVEIHPDLGPYEVETDHYFDLTTTPLQIIWNKREVTVEERKTNLKSQVRFSFKQIVDAEVAKETDAFLDTHYDANAVEIARQAYLNRLEQINGLSTHEEIDSFVRSL